jgi:hypothetical protein
MINALEEAVRAVHRALLRDHVEFCACPRCADDVAMLALNQAKPRYVDSAIGAAVTRVALSQDGAKAEIAVVVLDAMRRIAAHPRHDEESSAGMVAPAAGEKTR